MQVDSETGPQRTCQQATSGSSTHQRKRSQIYLDRTGTGTFIDHDVNPIIFHSRVEIFFYNRTQAVDLVDKQYIVLLQRSQYASQITRFVEYRTRCHLKTDAQFISNNIRKRCLSQSWRPVQQHMVQGFFTHPGSHDEYFQVLDHLRLPTEVVERKRTERVFVFPFAFRHPDVSYIKIVFHPFSVSQLFHKVT